MKHLIKNALFLFLALQLFSSCSTQLTPFTKRLVDQHNWSDRELEKIQFYLSEDIILRRTLGGDRSQISDGKIRVVDGKEVEEIVFRKGTPGVFVFSPKSDRMGVSFEQDGKNSFLMFGPNSKLNGNYALLGKEWNRQSGIVSYKGKSYRTSFESAYATLMVDLKKAKKVRYTQKTVGGRVIK